VREREKERERDREIDREREIERYMIDIPRYKGFDSGTGEEGALVPYLLFLTLTLTLTLTVTLI
jgi:hypothetical protein